MCPILVYFLFAGTGVSCCPAPAHLPTEPSAEPLSCRQTRFFAILNANHFRTLHKVNVQVVITSLYKRKGTNGGERHQTMSLRRLFIFVREAHLRCNKLFAIPHRFDNCPVRCSAGVTRHINTNERWQIIARRYGYILCCAYPDHFVGVDLMVANSLDGQS